MSLRPYQKDALAKMLWFAHSDHDGGGVICLPTGSGKSHLIASYAKEVENLLVLTPNKEILEQDYEKLKRVTNEIGIYSASKNSKEVGRYTIGTIQSIYKRPELFRHFRYVLIDEAHLVHPKNETMYMKLFRKMGARIIGLTATPYRMDSFYRRWGDLRWQVETVTTVKMLTRYYGGLFRYMLHVINPKDLMPKYLFKPEYKTLGIVSRKTLKFNKSKSDYDLEDFSDKVVQQLHNIAHLINNAPVKSSIVYCPTIDFAEAIKPLVHNSMVVTSKTNKTTRNEAVERFKNGNLKVLLNVSIYTLGFDYPDLESIFILRPTRSLILHTQMIGRLTRNPLKKQGIVYDLVGNVAELGKLEEIEVKKVNGKWNVVSPTKPNGFHMTELYAYDLSLKKQVKPEEEENDYF